MKAPSKATWLMIARSSESSNASRSFALAPSGALALSPAWR